MCMRARAYYMTLPKKKKDSPQDPHHATCSK